MRRLAVFCGAGLSIALMAVSVANASFSRAYIQAQFEISAPFVFENSSQSFVFDMASVWDLDGGAIVTYAAFDIGSASARAWTDNLSAGAESLAEPPANIQSLASGSAWQRWLVATNEPFTLTLTLHYSIQQDMATSPNQSARAGTGCSLSAFGPTSGPWFPPVEFNVYNAVGGGESGSWSYSGQVSVSHYFAWESGFYVEFYVGSQSEVTTIPAPGAMLLASIGAGLVGLLRRRRTI